jgi:hypothetical protein
LGPAENAHVGEMISLKLVVAFLPSILVRLFVTSHSRTPYALSLIIGVILQGSIPPRKGFVPMLVVASIIALVYVFDLPSWFVRLFS